MDATAPSRHMPRVLVVTASVGAGHNAAAQALIAALHEKTDLEIQVDLLDVLTLTPWRFRTFYARGYALAVSRMPKLYGAGFRVTNRPKTARRRLMEKRRLWSERRATRRFSRAVRRLNPDLIVHTHFLAPPVIGRLIRRNRLQTRQFIVVTDKVTHRYWYAEHVERWFVGSEEGEAPLIRWGIEPDRITVSGVPIHPKWSQPLDRDRIYRDWSLPSDKPIVVVSGGALFTCGPVAKIAVGITECCPDATVVVLAGHNKRLLGKLSQLAVTHPRIRAVSFTDRSHELVEVADLMVAKAGGLTTSECIAKAKPMLLVRPVPGQEAGNANYLAREGAAVIVRSARAVPEEAARLIADRGALKELSRNAGRLHRPATKTITEGIREALMTLAVS